jgi:LCP family protein required for cell wall assembly
VDVGRRQPLRGARSARPRSEHDTDVLPAVRVGGRDGGPDDRRGEARRIDASLTRLTAAHAGVTLADGGADRPPPAPRPARPRMRPVRVAVAAVVLLLFAVVAFGHVTKARLDDAVRSVEALDPGSGAIVDAAGQAGAENVLLVSTDGDRRDGPRGDTVLVVHVPPGGAGVVALSVPRDLEVSRPPCRRWDGAAGAYTDEVVPAEARVPLVSALDLGGPQCAVRVVQQLTGLAVTRYVGLDVAGVAPLVDALDGVEVCVDRPVVDALLGPVVPVAGPVALDGLRARDLVAARNVDGDSGGREVQERQARLLVAALREVLSPDVLLDPAGTGAVADALGGVLAVDAADLDRVLATGLALRSFAAADVTWTTVPTDTGPSGQGGAVLREAEAAELFAALRAGEPVQEQTVLASAGEPEPGEVSVEVLNASGRRGLAGEVGGTLGDLGFTVTGVGNADPTDTTAIRFSPDRAAAAQVLAAAVPSAVSTPDPGATGVLQLVLGRGFDDVLRAPVATTPLTAAATPVTCG